jgi:hypothetical protein
MADDANRAGILAEFVAMSNASPEQVSNSCWHAFAGNPLTAALGNAVSRSTRLGSHGCQ